MFESWAPLVSADLKDVIKIGAGRGRSAPTLIPDRFPACPNLTQMAARWQDPHRNQKYLTGWRRAFLGITARCGGRDLWSTTGHAGIDNRMMEGVVEWRKNSKAGVRVGRCGIG